MKSTRVSFPTRTTSLVLSNVPPPWWADASEAIDNEAAANRAARIMRVLPLRADRWNQRPLYTARQARSSARHGADDEKRLGASGDGVWQRGVGPLVRQVLLAGKEP